MDLALDTYAILTMVAFVAGFIDAIAGGGGLLTIPAMLWAGIPPIAALATNKLQSSFGSGTACWNFSRKGMIDWRTYAPTVAVIAALSALGSIVVQAVGNEALTLIVPVLLLAVAAYIVLSPRMHDEDAHQRLGVKAYMPVGGAIGFYDGFFGPGTGSVFVFLFVRLLGFDFLHASASAKLLNTATNAAALLLFAMKGHV
ncbi:MAG: TSUP family transporter, partial [Rhizorhabdus sp.]|uniref:TSUP family transporter n=1 Tax=Rhizorhabdus sp. TaxID=1968843 RepID=UPI001B75A348